MERMKKRGERRSRRVRENRRGKVHPQRTKRQMLLKSRIIENKERPYLA